MPESIKAATRLGVIVIVYSVGVAACQHSSEIGFLLDGVCKVAVNLLTQQNTMHDAGVPND